MVAVVGEGTGVVVRFVGGGIVCDDCAPHVGGDDDDSAHDDLDDENVR